MEKTRRMTLGVQKKTKPTKKNEKKFLNNVLDYLKSDCHMFAPLISPPLSGVKTKEPIEGNKKKVLMKVGKYLKSDTYMYAPLVSSRLMSFPPSGKIQWIRKFKEVPTRMLNSKQNHQSTESANLIAEKQPRKDSCPGMSTAGSQIVGHGKTVKHMVYHHCRSSSMLGHILCHMKCFITCHFILIVNCLAGNPDDMAFGPFFWLTGFHLLFCEIMLVESIRGLYATVVNGAYVTILTKCKPFQSRQDWSEASCS